MNPVVVGCIEMVYHLCTIPHTGRIFNGCRELPICSLAFDSIVVVGNLRQFSTARLAKRMNIEVPTSEPFSFRRVINFCFRTRLVILSGSFRINGLMLRAIRRAIINKHPVYRAGALRHSGHIVRLANVRSLFCICLIRFFPSL